MDRQKNLPTDKIVVLIGTKILNLLPDKIFIEIKLIILTKIPLPTLLLLLLLIFLLLNFLL